MPDDGITIPLTQGQAAVIDTADLALVSPYAWYAMKAPRTWYAAVDVYVPGDTHITLLMHRIILGDEAGAGVDHADGDGLNNRRSNLRPATPTQNGGNQQRSRNNTSGFKGVAWYKRDRRWIAYIREAGRLRYLGYFNTAEDGARAYDAAAVRIHGEYARLNFPCDRE